MTSSPEMARHGPARTTAAAVAAAAAALLAAVLLRWQLAPVPVLTPRNLGRRYDWRAPLASGPSSIADGCSSSDADDPTIRSFEIAVPDNVLVDLRERLKRTRPLAPPIGGTDGEAAWSYGMPAPVLADLLAYWADSYDWRAQEAKLNAWPQFVTEIDGLRTHFVHLKADRSDPSTPVYPLLLVHGWPGSIVEFLHVAESFRRPAPRGEPAVAFDVVMPSLPGYAFSEAPGQPGMGYIEVAVHLDKLMAKLGYTTYFYQGGDWGAMIGRALAQVHPTHVLGLHLNFFPATFPAQPPLLALIRYVLAAVAPSLVLPDPRERAKALPVGPILSRLWSESGYLHEHATRPDTLGVGLSDSPAGLAAWILEKFYMWSDAENGDLYTQFSRDDLVTNVMLYWVTNSITTSVRLYRESFPDLDALSGSPSIHGGVAVPVGLLCSPVNRLGVECLPRNWAGYLFHDIVQYSDLERVRLGYRTLQGGHFAALEKSSSDPLVKDFQSFVQKLIKRSRTLQG